MSDLLPKNDIRKRPTVLTILDGWGIAPVWGGNAISIAKTRNFDKAFCNYPSTTLHASGQFVGLPEGSPGNSEAGHLNIGAGYVVHQDGLIIDEEIETGRFFNNPVLIKAVDHAIRNNSNIHLMGLLSKTETHSQIKHLYFLLEFMKSRNFNRVYLDLFTDGRDSDPMSGIELANEVETKLNAYGFGQIVSIVGRFYAMDRDNRWDRIQKTYNLLVNGVGNQFPSSRQVFASSYTQGVTDEFIEPSLISNKSANLETITDNDAVIFFNFRSDRVKELTSAFLSPNFLGFPDRRLLKNLFFCSFVMHDENQLSTPVFTLKNVSNPLAKIWSDNGLRQFHAAETEKFAHITYFLNGGVEAPFSGEDRLMIPSPKEFRTYDLVPQMSLFPLLDGVVNMIKEESHDCFAVNFANPDMVGHTGNLKATVSAVEYVDQALGKLIEEVLTFDGNVVICADHGNAEQMVNPKTGEPDTEHTENPVPFIIVSANPALQKYKLRNNCSLSSITPTILDIMEISNTDSSKEASLIIKDNLNG